ncbi:hypothetical protein B0H19DRAFT_574955 [Mycena capillaripes]|nr:hypothetical protein B0H19DRAFT_574955 [Mycena capillaripes]
MNRLPNELLDRICSFLGRNELWIVVQLSSRFRSIAILPYLSRFGISQANIQSGSLALSDSFFIILVVARIRPIHRLVCFEEIIPGSQFRYRKLGTILSMTAPIPDIVIYNRHYMLRRTRTETAYLLSCIPSSATNTLLIVKGSTMSLSHPRATPPIRWKLLPPPLGSFNLSTPMKILIVMFGIPLLFAYLVSGVINFGVLVMWTYRRLSRPPWPQDERIIEDAGHLVFDDWMRIQTLPGKLTLVTLTDKGWPKLGLKPVPGLADGVYSSLLTSLDLGMHLQHLTVAPKTHLVHSELMAFLHRHLHLTSIHFEPDSIRPSSLTTMPFSPDDENKVYILTAPAPYIPYLLPAAPNAQRISILFSFAPAPKRSAVLLRAPAFDLPAYRSALASLATFPGTHPSRLASPSASPSPPRPFPGSPSATPTPRRATSQRHASRACRRCGCPPTTVAPASPRRTSARSCAGSRCSPPCSAWSSCTARWRRSLRRSARCWRRRSARRVEGFRHHRISRLMFRMIEFIVVDTYA